MTEPAEVSRVDWLAEYPPPRSLALDQEALRVYEHAYYMGIGTKEQGPPITFTTVMAALLGGDDETSRWFARLAVKNGPDAEKVYSEKKLTRKLVQSHRGKAGKPDQVQLSSTDKVLLTVSASAVIENAEGWAHRVGGSDIGVRHLVASYILNPPADHRIQMRRWNFRESKWRSVFFEWVAARYTAEQWTDASHRPAPSKAIPSYVRKTFKASSIAFPGDLNTEAVLRKAAGLHASRPKDPWLRLQTLFYALVETAREDPKVREGSKPILDAIDVDDEKYKFAQAEFFKTAEQPHAAKAFAQLDISPRVLNALETARALAVAAGHNTDGKFSVGVAHLAGALVSRRVDDDKELAILGLKPQELRIALIRYAQTRGESVELWGEALGEDDAQQAGRPVDLNSDEPEAVIRLDPTWTNDPLSIRRDVEAFAALLASKTLEPPLSIGLFGPWGSGKTTFLKRLRQAVDRRAGEAKDIVDGRPTAFVSNIVHVDFNAWHFAEDALTSSLVDTILRALSSYIKDDKQIVGKAWSEQKRDALESTKRKVAAAETVEAAAHTAVSNAETALSDKRRKAATSVANLQAVVQGVWDATRNELNKSKVVKESGVLNAVGGTIKSTGELQTRLHAVRTRPARLLGDLGWGRSILFAVLVLAVPPVVGMLVKKYLATDQAGQLLSSLTALVSVIGLLARTAAGAVAKVDKAVTEVVDEYARRLAEDEAVTKAQEDVDAAYTTAASAAAGLQAARDELARAHAEVANATVPAQMLQLVSSRLGDQSYNKDLTTLSLARADLEALSVLLRDQRSGEPQVTEAGSPPSGAQAGQTRAVDRVILYIDDLDRCKPTDVVRVLQLVHMLLAFELFVVVVAVDARWVEEALVQSYKWLSTGDANSSHYDEGEGNADQQRGRARVTPQDYLEKIFQICFWLEPMNTARAAHYLSSLVRTPDRDFFWAGQSLTMLPQSPQGPSSPVVSKIQIEAIELDYMRALAAYLGPSPRRVKRLVNSYRLIKARMPDSQLRTFLADRATDAGGVRSGPYQIVISLLVIGTGAPANSPEILKELAECDPGDGLDRVVERLRKRSHPDWTMAAQVIETLMRAQNVNDISELRGWALKVGRFLLNGQSGGLRLNAIQPAIENPAAPANA